MKWLTLERIKQQLRIEPDFHDEDDILELYGESAENAVLSLVRRNMANLVETYGRVPKPIVQATLMLVAISYQHREPASQQNMYAVPYAFDLLIKPYARLGGAEMPVDPVAYYLTDFYGRRIVTADDCYIVVIKRFD